MNFLSILDLEELDGFIDKALRLKKGFQEGKELEGKSLALIFEKASTRTRVSFEVAVHQLGGRAIYLSPKEMQLGRGETLADTARVLSRYVSAVVIRANHSDLEEYALHSTIPVINGLTEKEHPCQALADLMTIKEFGGSFKATLAYIGDGNNVCNSLLLGSAIVGLNMHAATPRGYEPDEELLEKAREISRQTGAEIELTTSPMEAARGADFIYTDVWVSMGQSAEREQRLRDFNGYQVNSQLLSLAPKAKVMHCLPAHRGEEITDEVMDSQSSIVFDEAENRLHAQKALLEMIFEEHGST